MRAFGSFQAQFVSTVAMRNEKLHTHSRVMNARMRSRRLQVYHIFRQDLFNHIYMVTSPTLCSCIHQQNMKFWKSVVVFGQVRGRHCERRARRSYLQLNMN